MRRFRCTNGSCTRQTFAEDFGESLPRSARRTKDATEFLVEMELKAGAEEGARLAAAAGLPVSPDTLLRLVRGRDRPALSPPRVLGIDDLALRRRSSSATLLVNAVRSAHLEPFEVPAVGLPGQEEALDRPALGILGDALRAGRQIGEQQPGLVGLGGPGREQLAGAVNLRP